MRISQILVTITRGDAIGNNALLLDTELRAGGHKTAIYAINIGQGLSEFVQPFQMIPDQEPNDIVLYHMCECSEINVAIRSMSCKKIAIYHNTTPARFFAWLDPSVAHKQTESLRAIQSLHDAFDLCIADSEFNKTDLVRLGYEENKITVIPIILSYQEYKKEPDAQTVARFSDGWTNLLFVGRVAPNKKHEDIIRAFAWYKKHINSKSRLILIGSPFSDAYMGYLNQYIATIGVEDVLFPGHISFKSILAFYSVADVFLCMSEHEGFCVPLVEAMMFDVPIVAYASTAIPDILGGSGVLVHEKDPVLTAMIIDRLVTDDAFRKSVVDGQRIRLIDFDSQKLFRNLMEMLREKTGVEN